MKTLYKLSFLILIFCFSVQAEAQSSRIKIKEKQSDPHKLKAMPEELIELHNGEYLTIGERRRGGSVMYFRAFDYETWFTLYDENMNFVHTKKFDVKYRQKWVTVEKLVRFQKDYFVFFSFDNVQKKKKYLFYALFDKDNLEIEDEIFKVAEIKLPNKQTRGGSFSIDVSDNEEFVVIFGNEPQKIKRQKFSLPFFRNQTTSSKSNKVFPFTYWVLDKDMQIVNYDKKHKLKIEGSSDYFRVHDYQIDNDGAIFILGKNVITEGLSRAERRKTRSSYKYDKSSFIVEKIDPDGTAIQYNTPNEDLFVDMDMHLYNDQIILVGLGGEQFYNSLVSTKVHRIDLDSDLEEINDESEEFTEEVLEKVNNIQQAEQSLNKRQKKRVKRREARLSKRDKEMRELAKRAALKVSAITYSDIDAEGNVAIILEEQWVDVVTTTHRTTNANGVTTTTTTTTYYYHYDDIVFVKLGEDEITQNAYNKNYVSINQPLRSGMEANYSEEGLTIITPNEVIKTDHDFESFVDKRNVGPKRNNWRRKKRQKAVLLKKILEDNTICQLAYEGRRKVAWYRMIVE